MIRKYMLLLWRASKLLIMTIRGKTTFGNQAYSIRALFTNKLAIAATGSHEAWLDDVFRDLLNLRDGAFIDVGANVGQTLIKILSIDKHRQYIGFEPQIACCFFIEQFLTQNQLKSHNILPIGLSNRAELLKLHMRRSSYDPTASTIELFRPDSFYSNHRYVQVARGDDTLPIFDLQAISILKIDVEGGELEVIEGLVSTINKYTPFIVFEVLNHYLAVTEEELDPDKISFREQRIEQMERLLRTNGYVIYNIIFNEGYRKVDRIDPQRSGDLRMTDYVAVPQTEEARFQKKLQYRLI